MNRIVSWVGVCGLVLIAGFAVYHFTGARGEVAKKKVLKTIDSWLGESDVQRAEIERGIKGMDEAVTTFTNARIKASVQADMLDKEVKANKKKIEESKAALARLGDELKKFDTNEKYSVSIGGKTYEKKDDLDQMARKVIDHHKMLVAQTESMEKRLETYRMTASTLEARETETKAKLVEMKDRLKELDAKIEMVKAQKEAAEALNEGDKTFAENVQKIEDKIKNLEVTTETATRKEGEKWKEISAKTQVENADKIINDTRSTASEIDALLGKK